MHYEPYHAHKWAAVFRFAARAGGLLRETGTAGRRKNAAAVFRRLIYGPRPPEQQNFPGLAACLSYWLAMQRKMQLAEELLRRQMPPLSPGEETWLDEKSLAYLALFRADAAGYWRQLGNGEFTAPKAAPEPWPEQAAAGQRLVLLTRHVRLDDGFAKAGELVKSWLQSGLNARIAQEYHTLRVALLICHWFKAGGEEQLDLALERVKAEFGWRLLQMPRLTAGGGPRGMKADHDLRVEGLHLPPRGKDVARLAGVLALQRPLQARMILYNCPIWATFRLAAGREGGGTAAAGKFCLLCEAHAGIAYRARLPLCYRGEAAMPEKLSQNSYRCHFVLTLNPGWDARRREELRRRCAGAGAG